MKDAPDTIMVLLTARPEEIKRRMRRDPMPRDQKGRRPGVLRYEDVDHALQRFQEEFAASLIRKKFVIDNSDLSQEETLSEFIWKVQKFLSHEDGCVSPRGRSWSSGANTGKVLSSTTRPSPRRSESRSSARASDYEAFLA